MRVSAQLGSSLFQFFQGPHGTCFFDFVLLWVGGFCPVSSRHTHTVSQVHLHSSDLGVLIRQGVAASTLLSLVPENPVQSEDWEFDHDFFHSQARWDPKTQKQRRKHPVSSTRLSQTSWQKHVLSCTRLRVPPVALHLSRYTCRSWFPGFVAFCRCSSGVAPHP